MNLLKKTKSGVKPFRAFNADSTATDFPAAKFILHADDYTAGSTSWPTRKGGNVLTMSQGQEKDSVGVYVLSATTVAGISGTMPTLSKYVVFLTIGRLAAASSVTGLNAGMGNITNGPYVSNVNPMKDGGGNVLTDTATLTGTVSNGSLACHLTYYDMVAATNPDVFRVLASATATDQAIPFGEDNTALTQLALGGTLANELAIPAHSGDNGSRNKIVALLDFDAPLTMNELRLAAVEMARTQELYAGWRNRAAAS